MKSQSEAGKVQTTATQPDRRRLVALPAYSPDFNPDEAIWDRVRKEVTAHTCFGTAAQVRTRIQFGGHLSST